MSRPQTPPEVLRQALRLALASAEVRDAGAEQHKARILERGFWRAPNTGTAACISLLERRALRVSGLLDRGE
ncbi:MAG TPA: hypothetical protein VFQ61_03010 [Polyangiaceae bacterium]|nr:hypothetical protein [Polyangiaceae bacterium]